MVRARGVTGLVDEGERQSAELGGPLFGNLDAAGVRGHDGGVLQRHAVAHVVKQDRHGGEMVDRAVEEALLLGCVQVDRHDAVGAGGTEQVEHEACGDGLAALMLLVLAGVAEERRDHGDGTCGGALHGVHHDELLHDPLVDRLGVGLHHEGVGATDGLGVTHVHLAVGEIVCGGFKDVDAELLGDILSQLRMNPSRNENKILIGLPFKDCAHHVSQRVVSLMQSSA